MRVLMLPDFYHPFDRGGSEQSVAALAILLVESGVKVAICTPDYQLIGNSLQKTIPIYRFPFFPKLKKPSDAVTPFLYLNPFFWLMSLFGITKSIRHFQPDILHVQGKYMLPQAILLGKLFKIPTVVTLRDYMLLCPLGFCIRKNNAYKSCSLLKLLFSDLQYYQANYQVSGILRLLMSLSLVYSFIIAKIYRHFLRMTDMTIAISDKLSEIYETNSIQIDYVIHNCFILPKIDKITKENSLIFVGRLTKGKGILKLIEGYKKLNTKKLRLKIIGDGYLKTIIQNNVTNNMQLLGQLSYEKTLVEIIRSKILIVPSIWEEPFGRTALEALILGVPVIASDRGGLPEIVSHKINGLVVPPEPDAIRDAICEIQKNYGLYRRQTRSSLTYLHHHFNEIPKNKHIALYKELL